MSEPSEPAAEHLHRVRRLCGFENRRSGSDAERRAAGDLAAALRASGAQVAVEPTYIHPQWPVVGFVHCGLAIAGSLIAGISPVAAFVLVLFTAVSLFGDLSGRWYIVRPLLFFRRASQNLLSPPLPGRDGASADAEEPARVIVCAAYDAPLTGAAYNDWALRAWARIAALWPARTSPQAFVFWSVALLLPPLGARMAGLDADWVSALQLPQTFLLLIAAFFYAEIALSPPSPGANDSAAAAAAALAVAERLRERPPETVEVVLLLAGAGQTTREGIRAFFRAHRRRLPKDRTWFIDIDSPGRGRPRFVVLEVPVIGQPAGRQLLELSAALTDGDPERGALPIGPATGASTAATYGYEAIALTARESDGFVPVAHHTPQDVPEAVDGNSVEAVAELATDLISLLDREQVRRSRAGAGD